MDTVWAAAVGWDRKQRQASGCVSDAIDRWFGDPFIHLEIVRGIVTMVGKQRVAMNQFFLLSLPLFCAFSECEFNWSTEDDDS